MVFNVRTCVIIPAAGSGKRFGEQIPKQFLLLDNIPIIIHTLRVFESHPMISTIVLSVSNDWLEHTSQLIQVHGITKVKSIILGGSERQFSIENALSTDHARSSDVILVHDAVRPFTSHTLITTLINAALSTGAAIPAIPPKDTIKLVHSDQIIEQTLERSLLRSAQTPQAFQRDILVNAYAYARNNTLSVTDDASLVEAMGIPVTAILGEESNIKITTPLDFKLAEFLIHNLNSPSS